MTLPAASTRAQFAAVCRDEAQLRPGVLALCDRLGLGDVQVARFSHGSLPVYAVGDHLVLKLFPQFCREHRTVEESVLRALPAGLPVPTPRVAQAGKFGGWDYILMTRLDGEPLTEVWPRLDKQNQHSLVTQLGVALAALHEIVIPGIGPPDWNHFISYQRAHCTARQRARGLGEEWLNQIPEFLDRVRLGQSPPALLHTEVMPEHLLAACGPHGKWLLSGLVDFEPAMTGAREYEFALIGLSISRGDGPLLRRLLTAYGYFDGQLDDAFQRRLLAYALLHRYSDLPKYLSKMPMPNVQTLNALAMRWWRLDT